MVKVWKNLKAYRGECAFETWVYRIAANCCMDFLRKRKREKSVSLEPLKEEGFDPPDESPGTEETAVIRDEHARLREAIAGLPEEQRDILVMTQLEGRSYEETARLLRISEGTVKSRLNRAREKLREIISGERELSGPASVQKSERRARR
jgi:RNA polymerase sigma-70 factor (ECF subfamily)